ncbi:MAG: hypothetical protein R3F65_06935 [bacterium]|nr:hypothetical protein [Myxococcales bacterium]
MHGLIIFTVLMAMPSPTATDPFGPECADTQVEPAGTHQARVALAVEQRGCRAQLILMQHAEYLARDSLVSDRPTGCEAMSWLKQAGRADEDYLTLDAAERICAYEVIWLRRPASVSEEDAACDAKARLQPLTFTYGASSPRDLRGPATRVYERLSGICWRREFKRLEQVEVTIRARLAEATTVEFDAALAAAAEASKACQTYEHHRGRAPTETRANWLDAAPLCGRLQALTLTPRPLQKATPVDDAPRKAPKPLDRCPTAPVDGNPSIDSLLPDPCAVDPTRVVFIEYVDGSSRSLGMAAGGFTLVAVTMWAARSRREDDPLTEVGVPLMLLSAAVLGAVAIILEVEDLPPPVMRPRPSAEDR